MYYIYTDGACSGNDSSKQCPGGYGFAIVYNDEVLVEGGGHSENTTNNRMELAAIIASLKKLRQLRSTTTTNQIKITIVTDSKYVVDNWNEYLDIWKSNGWRKSNGKQVLNVDLWKCMDSISSEFGSVQLQWVKGHESNKYNILADEMARGKLSALKRLSKYK